MDGRKANVLDHCVARVVASHGVPTEFPREAADEALRVPRKVGARERRGRRDLRALGLVTIDGADARDFDDAVHCRRDGAEFVLTVAIADASHYVPAGSALDREAAARGNSVYFPERVYPMLPGRLSNGICSLVPGEDRLCVCCEARVGRDGRVVRHEFFEGVMRSAARLTYDAVERTLDGGESHALAPMLLLLGELCDTLRGYRLRRGGLDIDLPETVPVLRDGSPVGFEVSRRLKAHSVVEECMLVANTCAAALIRRNSLRALHRVHPDPESHKVAQLRATLGNLGIRLAERPAAPDLLRVMGRADRRGPMEGRAIKMAVLRSLSKAVYTPRPSGHFGLAYSDYTHFTSPIRRYPDLLVHRAVKSWLAGRPAADGPSVAELASIGEVCTMTEVRATRSGWDLKSMLGGVFLSSRLGEEFDAVIVGVAEYGVFVSIEPHRLEGMVHVSRLGQDYFVFDAARQVLVGRRNGRAFGVGTCLRVRLEQTNPREMKTDFSLAEAGGAGRRRG